VVANDPAFQHSVISKISAFIGCEPSSPVVGSLHLADVGPRCPNVCCWPQAAEERRAEHVRSARVLQTSTCSAIAIASSTSIPRYLTVLSILVWPSKSWTARRLPVRR
jgi:hypothetical protein